MKKNIFALALCGALLLPGTAFAAGETRFSDVPAGSWFEQGVTTCAEKGVMIGTAEGVFSPEEKLSNAQCLTLALRIYDLQRGGTGELEKAPEDWGLITMTLVDGTVIKGQREGRPFGYSSFKRDGNADAHLYFGLEPDQVEWGKSVDAQTATVTLDGEICRGIAQCWEPAKDGNWVISFYQTGGDIWVGDYYKAPHPDVTEWYRDTVYTAEKWKLNDQETHPGFWELGRDLGFDRVGVDETCRYQFANALAEAAGELPRLYTVGDLPDLERYGYYTHNEKIFDLYDAGVLTGSDEYGSFGYFETLTRAQAAVMVARVLDESQRVQTPPKALPYLNYTLTEVEVSGWEFESEGAGEGADWLPVWRYCQDGKHFKDCAIYRADGTVFYEELEGGAVWGSPAVYNSGDSRYAHVERWRETSAGEQECDHGIFDVEQGKLVADYGSYEDYLAARQVLGDQVELIQWDADHWFPVGRDSSGNIILANWMENRYYNEDHVPVTPKFYGGGVGPVGSDGKGFVWKGDKVYRIQFE